jgi:hypothetical protein
MSSNHFSERKVSARCGAGETDVEVVAPPLRQIADHLGHRSLDTTRIYTKIDLRGLRQVAEFDLGALL